MKTPTEVVKIRRLRPSPKQNHQATRVSYAAAARDAGGVRRFVAVWAVLFPKGRP